MVQTRIDTCDSAGHAVMPLCIIILTYQSGAEIEQCVKAIDRLDGVYVVAIDNNSSDDTVRLLGRLRHERLLDSVILRQSNAGFARAINEAIAVTPADSDILLLNPDAVLDPGSLATLRAAARNSVNAGILSPLVYSSNDVKTTSAGEQPRLLPMLAHFSGLSWLCRNTRLFRGRQLYLDGVLESIEQVGWVAGSCMYIKRSTLNRVGLLSERWFMYAEDTEYCQRVTSNGLDMLLVTNARCFHAMGQSVKKSASEAINVMWPRSLTDYYKITFKPCAMTFLVWRLVFSLGLISRSWLFTLRARGRGDDNLRYEARRFGKYAGAVWSSRSG
jgi:N-acetylglucosaminyl-diphospho-decaprenol L-rhamnosyltransferase